ncbi:MAG: DsbA family protein [Solirubrobacteraceae bacterium]
MADVRITEFTDPACPWAFSAEPFRRRLDWLYGDRLEWQPRMVVLSEDPSELIDKGFDPPALSREFRKLAHDHGMPIDTAEPSRMSASAPACRAVVAARMHVPEHAGGLLRCLRVHYFSGGLLDDPAMIGAAAGDAGLDPDALREWMAEDAVETELRADMAAARKPSPAAHVLDARLANWSGGRRYTCPSYEITRLSDGVTISVPGYQPFAVYDVVLANLVPGLERREAADSVETVLAWAGTPLATAEVAEVCEISRGDAREQLGRVAHERHVGADGFWTLAA